jgi:membrane-bound lytic murein transglycosylase D
MVKTIRALPLLALFAAACAATAPPPKPAPIPTQSSVLVPQSSTEYRKDLEDALAQIAAREKAPLATVPRVDVEAAASIPIPDHRTIRGALALFSGQLKPSIQESLLRSAKYKKLIDKALEENKLPKGLAYLPVIESAYLPTLTSRAGAHGIWQFMPETARDYGLRVDWWVDERADPERSTRAAVSYLRDLYREFNDWPLVLAAYNAGAGRVHRALEDNGATTFWQLLERSALPKETRGYVPTFFATLMIASDPATYGFKLGEPKEIEAKRVGVEGPLSLHYLAEVANVDEAALRELNPALRRGIVPPGKADVRVPAKSAELVAARAATMKTDDANVAVCSFTLRQGDSLRRIARAIGTSVETILAMNERRSAHEGDSIYLPVRARDLSSALAHVADVTFYRVKKGDTLYSIGKKFGLSVEELRDLNDLPRKHQLNPGEHLRVTVPRAITAGAM